MKSFVLTPEELGQHERPLNTHFVITHQGSRRAALRTAFTCGGYRRESS